MWKLILVVLSLAYALFAVAASGATEEKFRCVDDTAAGFDLTFLREQADAPASILVDNEAFPSEFIEVRNGVGENAGSLIVWFPVDPDKHRYFVCRPL